MSVDKFKFISPGIFIDEIDESQVPQLPERMGPVIIGRFQSGPSNRPVKVESFKEFVQVFGNPVPGTPSTDSWRTGALLAPTYAAYAAQAWLRNNSPCNVIRLLGKQSDKAAQGVEATNKGLAGWITDNTPNSDISDAGGAYGLFVMPNPDNFAGEVAAGLFDAITIAAGDSDADTITINTPAGLGTDGGKAIEIKLTNLMGATPTANQINVDFGGGSTTNITDNIVLAINGTADTAKVKYGSNIAGGATSGINGLSAAEGSTTSKITLTATTNGSVGNNVTLTETLTNGSVLSALTGGSGPAVSGTLAAIWYVQDGAVLLEGVPRDDSAVVSGSALLVKSTNQTFKAKIVKNGAGSSNVQKAAEFNFDRDSDQFIRKVFNTNPTTTNDALVDAELNYWLGETFETSVQNDMAVTGTAVSKTGEFLGFIALLDGSTDSHPVDWHNHRYANVASSTGFFISQDTRGTITADFDPSTDTESLFKIHALDSGESANRDLKVSIQEIKAPSDNFNKFGTFTVLIRRATDTDNNPQVLERYSGCNLNPNSANYIARMIGDKEFVFDDATNVMREIGENDNRSKYVRVEVTDLVKNGEAEGLLPFGVYGPAIPATINLVSGSNGGSTKLLGPEGQAVKEWFSGADDANYPTASIHVKHAANEADAAMVSHGILSANNPLTASLAWPKTRLRVSSSEGGLLKGSQAYFGYQSNVVNTKRYDQENLDLLRGQPANFNGGHPANKISDTAAFQYSWIFTLDDITGSTDDMSADGNFDHAFHVAGSRAASNSITARNSSSVSVLDQGFNRFTSPMFGGFDGFDITEKDPLSNTYMEGSPTVRSNYAFHTIKKSIDMISDSEFIEYDIATIPGITKNTINAQLIETCENRGDALAIVDLEGLSVPAHENDKPESERRGNVTTMINNLKNLNINSSYGCAFYPFVKIRDLINDTVVDVPPSVVALGTFSSSQRRSAVWFAPAGFTRGGLSEGSAGIPVVGIKERVVSADRDRLYDANINPIASFPAEGVVIFGQKTLQVTPSALDRINVRRLLILVKKEISRIASTILFDQNVQATWDRFSTAANSFLNGVKAGLGVTDFRVQLDDKTTTEDLIDRNILYAKIFIKPAKAIEFIALDFIVTRSGASFED
ncbi:MAG: hypothetical protein CL554_20990 [Algoriphagus sp.]|uniref:phage tail sheath C-terminal domain-containing protein n=1 Tax=Algoriphagus sp. TaxID=1872435 RepID=UPI000C5F427B|nr:phage tail sheath C-terminal domain-containing protein [Algoriphagus sp.]MAL15886.1 hypothetical protein [Algoriphagus sp.]